MSYLIYLRKSRADLEAEAYGEGETLSRHREALSRLAVQRNLQVDAIYEEVVSGDTIAARPKMQQLLAEVEAGLWDGVVCMEVERLARGDSIDQGIVARAFKYSETLIITPAKTYDPSNEFDEEYFEFGLFMSRREYKTIRRRLTAGVQASRRQGKFTGNIPPYGYLREKLLNDKGYTLTPDPQFASIVCEVFRLFVQERSNIYTIAGYMNEIGAPRRDGAKWSSRSVSMLLRNPHYAGYTSSSRRPSKKVIENGQMKITRPVNPEPELYEGLHEALVDRDLWHKAQKLLQQNSRPPVPRYKGLTNAFRGLIYCAACGSRMQRSCYPQSSRRDPYVFCMNHKKGCCAVSASYSLLEQLVLDALRSWLKEYTVVTEAPAQSEEVALAKALANVEANLSAINARAERAYELVETGAYSVPLYLERKSALEKERASLQRQQCGLQLHLAQLQTVARLRNEFLPQVRQVLQAYPEAANAQEQNTLLRTVIAKIMYQKNRRTLPNAPSDLTLQIFPLLPSTADPV